jgi:hypothetical protein
VQSTSLSWSWTWARTNPTLEQNGDLRQQNSSHPRSLPQLPAETMLSTGSAEIERGQARSEETQFSNVPSAG